jgi:hypothetical protein
MISTRGTVRPLDNQRASSRSRAFGHSAAAAGLNPASSIRLPQSCVWNLRRVGGKKRGQARHHWPPRATLAPPQGTWLVTLWLLTTGRASCDACGTHGPHRQLQLAHWAARAVSLSSALQRWHDIDVVARAPPRRAGCVSTLSDDARRLPGSAQRQARVSASTAAVRAGGGSVSRCTQTGRATAGDSTRQPPHAQRSLRARARLRCARNTGSVCWPPPWPRQAAGLCAGGQQPALRSVAGRRACDHAFTLHDPLATRRFNGDRGREAQHT